MRTLNKKMKKGKKKNEMIVTKTIEYSLSFEELIQQENRLYAQIKHYETELKKCKEELTEIQENKEMYSKGGE